MSRSATDRRRTQGPRGKWPPELCLGPQGKAAASQSCAWGPRRRWLPESNLPLSPHAAKACRAPFAGLPGGS